MSVNLMTLREASERDIHLAVMNWVRLHPKISHLVLHYPNESKRSPSYGALLKKMGMRKGVSDLFIAIANHGHHGAWIEIKTKKGKATPSQLVFLEDMRDQGYYIAITKGVDETIETLKWYCFG